MERNQAYRIQVLSVLTFLSYLIVRLCILEYLKLVVTFEILVCHVLFIFLFLLKGRHKMAVAGVLSFLMEKKEKVDRGDRSFFKVEVTDRDCLAEMTILCQTHIAIPPVARKARSLRISQAGTRSSAYSSKLLCLGCSCSSLWKKKGNPVLF